MKRNHGNALRTILLFYCCVGPIHAQMIVPTAPIRINLVEAAEIVGDKVVRDLVEHWAERESTIPHTLK